MRRCDYFRELGKKYDLTQPDQLAIYAAESRDIEKAFTFLDDVVPARTTGKRTASEIPRVSLMGVDQSK